MQDLPSVRDEIDVLKQRVRELERIVAELLRRIPGDA
jgi:hypothetical protein